MASLTSFASGCAHPSEDPARDRAAFQGVHSAATADAPAFARAPIPEGGSSDAPPPKTTSPPPPPPEETAAKPALRIPEAVLRELSPKPYVEERCEPTTIAGRTDAKRCAYSAMGLEAEVVTLSPSPERVGAWLVDAATQCEPLESIRAVDEAAWSRGVLAFAKHLRRQSSRIFPVAGAIVEDLGSGPTAFGFDRGVVTPCDKGRCRCRVNSLTPAAYCRYVGRDGDERACLDRFDGPAGIEAWREHCLGNHLESLGRDENPHLRAHAFVIGARVAKRCAPRAASGKPCKPLEIAMLLERELGVDGAR